MDFPHPVPQVNDSLSVEIYSAICPSFVSILLFPLCGINVSLAQAINLTS